MYKQLIDHHRLKETLFMGFLSLACFSFSIFRFVYSDTRLFLFLNWNLFLAFIPWMLSSILIIYPGIHRYKLAIVILLISWLLFFPNAPYILTDLFHLRLESNMPIWFDLVLILSFAWTGLLFGFMSLWDIEFILKNKVSNKLLPVISTLLLFLGSFGIYVGRYLRWNSWDILQEPFKLFYDIGDNLINPFHHARTWGMTLFMFLFLSMIYWSFRFVKNRGSETDSDVLG
jgi:uncharacterized membrane protein